MEKHFDSLDLVLLKYILVESAVLLEVRYVSEENFLHDLVIVAEYEVPDLDFSQQIQLARIQDILLLQEINEELHAGQEGLQESEGLGLELLVVVDGVAKVKSSEFDIFLDLLQKSAELGMEVLFSRQRARNEVFRLNKALNRRKEGQKLVDQLHIDDQLLVFLIHQLLG